MEFLNKSNIEHYNDWLENAQSIGSAALIDKDIDWTSFDVVAKLRSLTRIKKIGHAGTLDPFATGLLILCFGKATKNIEEFQSLRKSYQGIIKLGATTKTNDSTSEEENCKSIDYIDNEKIIHTMNKYIGRISQIPPNFSAKKIQGKRAYDLARKNKEFKIEPVQVIIYKLDILKIAKPYIEFSVECSKGTYIRALARDIGAELGCGAYLTELRRTAIGEYHVSDALKIEELVNNLSDINKLKVN